jgi:hypothetical protein
VSNSQALDYFYQDMSKWHWSELQQKPKSKYQIIFQAGPKLGCQLSSPTTGNNFSTFYEQLLHMKIPEAQKRLTI